MPAEKTLQPVKPPSAKKSKLAESGSTGTGVAVENPQQTGARRQLALDETAKEVAKAEALLTLRSDQLTKGDYVFIRNCLYKIMSSVCSQTAAKDIVSAAFAQVAAGGGEACPLNTRAAFWRTLIQQSYCLYQIKWATTCDLCALPVEAYPVVTNTLGVQAAAEIAFAESADGGDAEASKDNAHVATLLGTVPTLGCVPATEGYTLCDLWKELRSSCGRARELKEFLAVVDKMTDVTRSELRSIRLAVLNLGLKFSVVTVDTAVQLYKACVAA